MAEPSSSRIETRSVLAVPPAAGVILPPGRALAWPEPARARHRRYGLLAAGLVLLLLLAGGIGWYSWWRPLPVSVLQPTRGTAVEAVYATGMVEAIDTARIGSVIPGRIVALAVDEGDEVRRGQLVATLDDRQALQRLEDAKARLSLAEEELKRSEALLKGGYRSQEAVQQARKERDQAKAGVDLLARQLEDCRIAAPLDGIVMKRLVEPGETIAANAVLFEVASPARLRVAADVDERDITAVRMGSAVAVRADAFPDLAFQAKVTNIRRQGDAATRTYRVEAELPADTGLMIGMTLDVNIVLAERADVLLLPNSAVLHEAPQGGRPGAAYVYRLEEGRAHRVAVALGAQGNQSVEIRSGLEPEDEILADPAGIVEDRRVRRATVP